MDLPHSRWTFASQIRGICATKRIERKESSVKTRAIVNMMHEIMNFVLGSSL